MSWNPIHPHHAIERTRIVVQFKDKLPQKTILKLGEAFDKHRAEFGFGPRVEVQTHTLVVGQDVASPQMLAQQARGWQYLREASQGVVLEAIVLDPEGLVYECVEYTRWADFWGRASVMVLPLVDGLSSVTDLRLFSLEYFDRFVFNGAPNQASPVNLITGNLIENLPESAKSGEELWHLHRGWYETSRDIRVLINQNIDANEGKNASGDIVRAVGVYTKVERRNRSDMVDPSCLGQDIEKMHEISKVVFSSAINDAIKDRIGLDDSSGA